MKKEVVSDYLVIGSGIAGLTLALKAAAHGTVALITKRALNDTATDYAQGGLAAVVSPEDSIDEHIRDTIGAGGGLCKEETVRFVVSQAPERIRELIEWGVRFSSGGASSPSESEGFQLGLEGGHSKRRILHVGDYTGHAVQQALIERVLEHPRITVFDHHAAVNLITLARLNKAARGSAEDACAGAYVLDSETGSVRTFLARGTALCTGGAGKVYLYTSNPDISTGDGMALAYRAGARLANMEFVQFHPTCLYEPKAKNFLISEALRGEGALLKNRAGERFVLKHDSRGELAPRDIVARAIDEELKRSGDPCVYLDISHKGAAFIARRFPRIRERCALFGIDITAQPIPVVPAAHYFCGGIWTDLAGQSTLKGLYAVGEAACTGLHGANRLASNSLPEALVFAHAVAGAWEGLKDTAPALPAGEVPPWNAGQARDPDEQVVIAQLWDEIRRFMWNFVGIARTTKRLQRAKNRIALMQNEIREHYWEFTLTQDLLELRNLAAVSQLVIECALVRAESRGLHHNRDFPERNDNEWQRHTFIDRAHATAYPEPAPAPSGRG